MSRNELFGREENRTQVGSYSVQAFLYITEAFLYCFTFLQFTALLDLSVPF